MINTEYGITAELMTMRAGDLDAAVSYDGRYLVRFAKDGEPNQADLDTIKEVIRRFSDATYLDEPGAYLEKGFGAQ